MFCSGCIGYYRIWCCFSGDFTGFFLVLFSCFIGFDFVFSKAFLGISRDFLVFPWEFWGFLGIS